MIISFVKPCKILYRNLFLFANASIPAFPVAKWISNLVRRTLENGMHAIHVSLRPPQMSSDRRRQPER